MEALGEEAVNEALERLRWQLRDGELEKVVRREGFSGALAYVNEVGALAEAAGHHPDIAVHFDTVTLRLSTHSLRAITEADLSLAARIDALD